MDALGSLEVQCLLQTAKKTYCHKGQVSYDAVQLSKLFPHLQALSLAGAYPVGNAAKSLNFPWDHMPMDLPLNFSHSDFKVKQSTRGYRLNVDVHQMTRTLSVIGHAGLDIKSVCTYKKSLNNIILSHDTLTSLPPNCFSPKAKGRSVLFYLDLANNEFEKLPDTIFQGLTALETLHLSSCRITELQVGTFDDLINLQLLNLDYNILTQLRAGVFTKLISLKSLFIHQNMITHMDYQSLPAYSQNLTFVDLRWNQLITFPYDCLTLPKLSLCDCDHNHISIRNLSDIISYFDPIRMYLVQPLAYYGESYSYKDVSVMHETDQSEISLRDNNIRTIDFDMSWPV